MGKPKSQRHETVFRGMTPVHIREPREADYLEVAFLESARFYRLSKRNPIYHQIVKLLRDAIGKKRALQVRCASAESDMIVEVRDCNSPSV
jgi:hypothetical protein